MWLECVIGLVEDLAMHGWKSQHSAKLFNQEANSWECWYPLHCFCVSVNIKKDKCAIPPYNLPGHPFFCKTIRTDLSHIQTTGRVCSSMLLGEVKFPIYNPPASFHSKFQGYRTAEFTGAHTVLGHLVQEAFKSPQSVDSHRAISSYISWCLRV